MSLSRVESRKRQLENGQRRRKKRNLFTIIQLCLIAMILLALGVFFQGDRLMGWVDKIGGKLTGQERVIHTVPGAANDPDLEADAVEPDAAGQGQEHEQDSTTNEQTDDSLQPDSQSTDDTVDNEAGGDEQSSGEQEQAVEPPAVNEGQTVQLAFVGDLLLGEYIQHYLQTEGVSYPYQQALFHLTSADITAGNLEMPITTASQPAENKTYVFKGEPKSLEGLVDAGFDVVSLANNHTLDHGVTGLQDTMKHLDEYGIAHIGAGNNAEEAYAPFIREVNGIKVAYVATSRVLPETTWKANRYDAGLAESYDPTQTLNSIAELEETANITVVLVHWGLERAETPDENQLKLAKMYIDAGADLVIGSHPHVLQGFQQYKDKWIAYSLGNFVFSANPKEKQAQTGVLTATCGVDASCELQFAPMKVVNAQPTPVEGSVASEMLKYLEKISPDGIKIDERGNIARK